MLQQYKLVGLSLTMSHKSLFFVTLMLEKYKLEGFFLIMSQINFILCHTNASAVQARGLITNNVTLMIKIQARGFLPDNVTNQFRVLSHKCSRNTCLKGFDMEMWQNHFVFVTHMLKKYKLGGFSLAMSQNHFILGFSIVTKYVTKQFFVCHTNAQELHA